MLNNTLKVFRVLLSGLVFTIFCLVATGSLFLHAAMEALTSPDEMVTLLQTTRFAERSRPLVADILVTFALQNNTQAAFIRSQTIQVWESVAQHVLPVNWLEQTTAHLLLGTLNWLTTDQLILPVYTIDLTLPRQELNSSQGSLAVLPLLQNIPECAVGTDTITIFDGSMVSCLPANYDLTDLAQLMAVAIAEGLPDKFTTDTIRSTNILNPETYQSIEHLRSAYRLAVNLEIFGLRLALFLFCIYCLLQARSMRALVASLPAIFLIAGALTVLLIVGGRVFLGTGLPWVLTTALPTLPANIQLLFVDVIREFYTSISRIWLTWAAGLLALGGIILVSRLLYERLNKSQPQTLVTRRRNSIRKVFR